MSVTASAPGKLVLFGDHAAVYGYPCLVTAVDLRFRVTAEIMTQAGITIETPDLSEEIYHLTPDQLSAHDRPATTFVEAALKQFRAQHTLPDGLHIVTTGPRITYGLGSSSAITAATLAAVARLCAVELPLPTVFDLAYAAVLDVQGTGSGVDLAAAVYGGTVYYVKGGQVLEPLHLETLPIVIGYSGAKVSTTNLIAHVAELQARQPRFIDALLAMLGDISTQARAALENREWTAVGDLMNIHQGILDAFGVNTLRLAQLVDAARAGGASGAKLSGAGGGDCMFALAAPGTAQAVKNRLTEAGGLVVDYPVHAPGVRLG
jgi:mevalonate kinase